MDKQILAHKKFVQSEIKKLRADNNKTAARDLLTYHEMRVKDFQHERAIHLAVTFFFAVVTVISLAISALFYYIISATGFAQNWSLGVAPWSLSLILVILEINYVRYYYRLENRTQKLYDLTDEIYRLL